RWRARRRAPPGRGRTAEGEPGTVARCDARTAASSAATFPDGLSARRRSARPLGDERERRPEMGENRRPQGEPKNLPKAQGGIVAYMQLSDAAAASAFYQKAFAAEEVTRMLHPDGQRLIHCHLYINGGSLMLNDPFPEQGMALEAPAAFTLTLMVDDIDAW